ncbi:hypothetical protein [Amycolatopsis sp. lyj-108]|uniref:hypothetical protein n=1 Tax=Amycolatopsis sp. lyj-108 TaxID=2789286 RepID=UPI00397AC905
MTLAVRETGLRTGTRMRGLFPDCPPGDHRGSTIVVGDGLAAEVFGPALALFRPDRRAGL